MVGSSGSGKVRWFPKKSLIASLSKQMVLPLTVVVKDKICIELFQKVQVNLGVRLKEFGPLAVHKHVKDVLVFTIWFNVKDFPRPGLVLVHFEEPGILAFGWESALVI
ncbi:hypothetical protein MtrunA17_Chr6g0467241 [Medicago truncatula]|uniref:Uncharacterized protein n=1 Tax=Medicago truncatula TaxID=3880 RepID=A0A072U8G2_MEDTR|nr:hypothetical protein MTR_6g043440 [Medicago truncatula]RHN51315.1 hypothetical protein MtrunA17_Chr6g0467241 [Medicago truncatula]